jgi:hypothetical protein
LSGDAPGGRQGGANRGGKLLTVRKIASFFHLCAQESEKLFRAHKNVVIYTKQARQHEVILVGYLALWQYYCRPLPLTAC